MSDLIDRREAIDALGERPMVWVGSDYGLGARNQYDADVLALETIPSAQPGWIPCSERLPSKADHTDDMVLVCYRNGSVRFNTYMNGWVQGNPVAWMPLPEPYKEDEHEID